MRKILWVTAIEPSFDAGGGGQIRQAHLLAALADRFDLHLLLAGSLYDDRVRALMSSVREVPVVPVADPRGRMRRRIRDLRWQVLERRPDEVARQRHIRRALAPAISNGVEPDIVCVEYIGLASLLPRRRRGFWALTLHNLTSEMARHNAGIAPGRRQRTMLALEERNSRRLEHQAAQAYDLVITVSPEDAARLPGGAAVVPNGVDTARFEPSPLPDEPRLVFTGGLHTLPNRDGIRWFCEEVWPYVRERVRDAKLDVVGSRPPVEVLALGGHDGVTIYPNVPDAVPFLRAARVAVVPLRIGSGSRLKALEAMAAGRPVVGTTIGLGGLDTAPDQDVLIADDPVRFADAVVRCLTDRELAGRLGVRGRALVTERYSWTRIGTAYATLLEGRAFPTDARAGSSLSTSATVVTN